MITTRHATTIFLRLVALVWGVKGILLLGQVVISAAMYPSPFPSAWQWASPLFGLLISVGLWMFSAGIANMVCRDCESEIPVANVSAFVLYRTVFIGVGLWAVTTSAGYLYSWFHFFATRKTTAEKNLDQLDVERLSQDVISVILGLALILSSHIWAKKLCQAKRAELEDTLEN